MSNSTNKPWIYYDENGRMKIRPQRLYIFLRDSGYVRIGENGVVFVYDPIKGVYQETDYQGLMAYIKSFMPEDIRKFNDYDAVRRELTTEPVDVARTDFDAQERFINFQNGVLDTETLALLPHDPKYLQIRQAPCDYNPQASMRQAPTFYKFVNDLLPGDTQTQAFLLEFIGACISSVFGHRFKKALLLVGPGNTGKTQIRSFMEQVIGEKHSISIDMRELNQNRFAPSLLECKRFSGSGDMSYMQVEELNIFKSLTGGDTIFAERKHEQGFNLTYTGFLWYNTNKLPYFRGDLGEHLYSRMMIVQCNNPIPVEQQDRNLLAKMLAEKEIIINLAIKFFLLAVERGYQFTESDVMREARENYKIENNSLFCFVKLRCVPGDGRCKRSDFNRKYRKWCADNMLQAERSKDVEEQLKEQYSVQCHKTAGEYYYVGIELLDDGDDDFDPVALSNACAQFFANSRKRK